MPERKTIARVKRDQRQGKSASTQAGEFVREEIEHIREGKHGARSPEQAIAIGLSKARRAGVALPPPKAGQASPEVRERAERDLEHGQKKDAPDRKRSQSSLRALKDEGKQAASKAALSQHAKKAARRRRAVAAK